MTRYAHPEKPSRFILLLALSLLMTMAGPGQQAAAQKRPAGPAGTAAFHKFFGYAVDLSGDYLIVGSTTSGPDGTGPNSAFIFERHSDGNWYKVANPAPGTGGPVALSGNRALIMGRGHLIENQGYTSAAYIFERQADGSWIQVAKLEPDDARFGDCLGCSPVGSAIALEGDRVLIGASGSPPGAGAAYIFERQADGSWIQTAKLKADDISYADFGRAVALSGDRVFVSATYILTDPFDPTRYGGVVYVFDRQPDGSWAQTAILSSPETANSEQYGTALALEGDRALIGTVGGWSNEGAAYVMERQPDGTWNNVARLVDGTPTEHDWFGQHVALEGNRALLGQVGDNGEGAVYVFERQSGGAWNRVARLEGRNLEDGDMMGRWVALDGNRIAAGAPRTYGRRGPDSGAVFVFDRQTDGTWKTAIGLDIDSPEPPTDPLAVTRLVLVDADTDQDLFELTDGATYDLSQLPPFLNVRADVGTAVRSVRFNVSPQSYQRTESVAPFALFGDTNGDYLPGAFNAGASQAPGQTTLRATPFAQTGGRGTQGTPLELTLSFTGTPSARVAVPTGTFEEGAGEAAGLPAAYALEANYPNPFNPSTVISFSLPEASPVRVAVYDLLGRQVALLAEGPMPAGRHEVSFDGSGLSSGLYLYRMEAAGQAFVRRMHLLK